MKAKPILIKPDTNGLALEPLPPERRLFSESWLQVLLHNHPEILPVDEIEPVFWPLAAIGREITTNVGLIDNLFISSAGYPVIVETKLWRNPEAKREVLAQAIDYAGELAKWTFEQFDELTRRLHQKGVVDFIQSAFDLDQDQLPDENHIARNLRLGRFLILVVSDQIHSSLVGMLNYINRYPHLATNIGLVELQCYHMPDNPNDIIVVPNIIARTEIVERSIVQVTIQPEVAHQIDVEQKKSKPDSSGRQALTEEAFWEALQQKAPGSVNLAKQVLDYFSQYPEIELQMRQTAVVVRMTIPETDQRLSLFFITKDGLIECWSRVLVETLENTGIDRSIGIEYKNELSALLKQKRKEFSIYQQLDKLDIQAFIPIVERFIENVKKAEIPEES